jgi:hypothetical protein
VETISRIDKSSFLPTAQAFVTYSLVPYLGILFCPGALLMGIAGCVISYRDRARRRSSWATLLAGVVILAIQVFLWWLLYKIPAWSLTEPAGRATGPAF